MNTASFDLRLVTRQLEQLRIEPLAVHPQRYGIGGTVVEVTPVAFVASVPPRRRWTLRLEEPDGWWLADLGWLWLATDADAFTFPTWPSP